MKNRSRHLSVAAVTTMLAVAGPGVALATEGGSPGSSSAEIKLTDCMLESSKEISYVEYLDEGATVAKDESVESETLDLTTVEGIEDVDAVAVKAGTTVESFSVACAGESEEEAPEEPEDGSEDDGNEAGRANPRSTATITLAGCTLESSKDISYVGYLADGSMVAKDESMDSETFDLTTVESIEAYDAVQVKSGTTVESFAIACSDGETAPVGETTTDVASGDRDETMSGHDGGTERPSESDGDGEGGHDEAKHQEQHQAHVSENHDEAKHQANHRGGRDEAEGGSDDGERADRESKRGSDESQDDSEREREQDEGGDDLDD